MAKERTKYIFEVYMLIGDRQHSEYVVAETIQDVAKHYSGNNVVTITRYIDKQARIIGG